MTQPATSAVVERQVHIAASPETVFKFLTEPDRFVQWMGRRVEIDPKPGGIFRLSVPDYRSPVQKRRSVYDWRGRVTGDLLMGAEPWFDDISGDARMRFFRSCERQHGQESKHR